MPERMQAIAEKFDLRRQTAYDTGPEQLVIVDEVARIDDPVAPARQSDAA